MKNIPRREIRQLVSRAQGGDEDAFSQLYMATSQAQYFTALSILKDAALAEDAVQTTYMRVYQNLKSLSSPAGFLAWLTSIHYHTCVNLLAKTKKASKELETQISDDLADADQESFLFDRVVRRENRSFLLDLLGELTPSHRDVILLRYYHGLKIKDIARLTKTSEGTVRSRIHYALKKLQNLMSDQGYTGTDSLMGVGIFLSSSFKSPASTPSSASGRTLKLTQGLRLILVSLTAGGLLIGAAYSASLPAFAEIAPEKNNIYVNRDISVNVRTSGKGSDSLDAFYENGEELKVKKIKNHQYQFVAGRNGLVKIRLYDSGRFVEERKLKIENIDRNPPEILAYVKQGGQLIITVADDLSGLKSTLAKASSKDSKTLPVNCQKGPESSTLSIPCPSDDTISLTVTDKANNSKTYEINTEDQLTSAPSFSDKKC